jgi:hypothetical protein
MTVDHSNTIVTNVFMSASPPARAGFGLLHIVDQDTNSLNGLRLTSYSSASEVAAARTAGYISATTESFLNSVFMQSPPVQKVWVGFRDVSAAETFSAALLAIEAINSTDWWAITSYSRVDADIVALAALAEARKKFYFYQSDDASFLDAGLPTGLAALASYERVAALYHSSDAQPGELAWAASRLVFNPDTISAAWTGPVSGVEAVSTITSAQRDACIANNANIGLPFSSAAFYVSRGVNMKGRPIEQILTGDWFSARISEDTAYVKLSADARGQKIMVDITGQTIIRSVLDKWLLIGKDAGHWPEGQYRSVPLTITDADILAKRLRFNVEAQVAGSATNFEFNIFLQQTPLAAA